MKIQSHNLENFYILLMYCSTEIEAETWATGPIDGKGQGRCDHHVGKMYNHFILDAIDHPNILIFCWNLNCLWIKGIKLTYPEITKDFTDYLNHVFNGEKLETDNKFQHAFIKVFTKSIIKNVNIYVDKLRARYPKKKFTSIFFPIIDQQPEDISYVMNIGDSGYTPVYCQVGGMEDVNAGGIRESKLCLSGLNTHNYSALGKKVLIVVDFDGYADGVIGRDDEEDLWTPAKAKTATPRELMTRYDNFRRELSDYVNYIIYDIPLKKKNYFDDANKSWYTIPAKDNSDRSWDTPYLRKKKKWVNKHVPYVRKLIDEYMNKLKLKYPSIEFKYIVLPTQWDPKQVFVILNLPKSYKKVNKNLLILGKTILTHAVPEKYMEKVEHLNLLSIGQQISKSRNITHNSSRSISMIATRSFELKEEITCKKVGKIYVGLTEQDSGPNNKKNHTHLVSIHCKKHPREACDCFEITNKISMEEMKNLNLFENKKNVFWAHLTKGDPSGCEIFTLNEKELANKSPAKQNVVVHPKLTKLKDAQKKFVIHAEHTKYIREEKHHQLLVEEYVKKWMKPLKSKTQLDKPQAIFKKTEEKQTKTVIHKSRGSTKTHIENKYMRNPKGYQPAPLRASGGSSGVPKGKYARNPKKSKEVEKHGKILGSKKKDIEEEEI